MPTTKKADHTEKLSHTTTDHDEIRHWAEARKARPSCVKHTGGKDDVGVLRLDFSGSESLHDISWDEFFEKFDASGLALVYQEHTAEGEPSNFNKLISREGIDEKSHATAKSKTKKAGLKSH